MELDEDAKDAVRELGQAINSAIERSPNVSNAIEYLRDLGYEPNLSLKLEIGLLELTRRSDPAEVDIEFTEEDIKALRKMKINVSSE
jgi:hypothetical protein